MSAVDRESSAETLEAANRLLRNTKAAYDNSESGEAIARIPETNEPVAIMARYRINDVLYLPVAGISSYSPEEGPGELEIASLLVCHPIPQSPEYPNAYLVEEYSFAKGQFQVKYLVGWMTPGGAQDLRFGSYSAIASEFQTPDMTMEDRDRMVATLQQAAMEDVREAAPLLPEVIEKLGGDNISARLDELNEILHGLDSKDECDSAYSIFARVESRKDMVTSDEQAIDILPEGWDVTTEDGRKHFSLSLDTKEQMLSAAAAMAIVDPLDRIQMEISGSEEVPAPTFITDRLVSKKDLLALTVVQAAVAGEYEGAQEYYGLADPDQYDQCSGEEIAATQELLDGIPFERKEETGLYLCSGEQGFVGVFESKIGSYRKIFYLPSTGGYHCFLEQGGQIGTQAERGYHAELERARQLEGPWVHFAKKLNLPEDEQIESAIALIETMYKEDPQYAGTWLSDEALKKIEAGNPIREVMDPPSSTVLADVRECLAQGAPVPLDNQFSNRTRFLLESMLAKSPIEKRVVELKWFAEDAT